MDILIYQLDRPDLFLVLNDSQVLLIRAVVGAR